MNILVKLPSLSLFLRIYKQRAWRFQKSVLTSVLTSPNTQLLLPNYKTVEKERASNKL